ncbi:DNA/RNA helicase domain-containing protein [Spiroplasma turonicum]|uniref:ATP/GTP binding protein n=1 Tax=Spiroplasma turonicum TaxID=216946 RepID=A0A0K1P687_9MOLU|nr:DNA/RNA helicase domain-containing protein [Spiroplasma turonicum]AKU79699.1 ATP/GTP binding protein [Spiroplasma turonicum]ALX70717.1 hypothetical protein STURO_v1c04510 [Spiroplasma turonicum]
MICYKATIKEFIQDIYWKSFDHIFKELYNVSSSNEIKSWEVSLMELWEVIAISDLNESVDIYLEYKFDFSESRCDAILIGNVNGVDKVVVIELKQHKNFSSKSKGNDMLLNKGSNSYGYLGSQILRYINFFETFSNINGLIKKYEIIGVAYLHNLSRKTANNKGLNIESNDWFVRNTNLKLFFKNEKVFFAQYLSTLFYKSEKSSFIKLYEENIFLRGLKTTQVLNNITSEKSLVLTDYQYKMAEQIIKIIKSSSDEKKLFIIRGSAGTGKTIFIYYLYLFFKNIKKYKDKTYIMARNQTYVKNINAYLNENYRFKKSSYIEKKKPKSDQIIFFDEGQRVTPNQLVKAIEDSKAVIICLDEKQKINNKDKWTINWLINYYKEKYPKGILYENTLINKLRFLNNTEYISMVESLFTDNDSFIDSSNSNISLYNNQSEMHQDILKLVDENKNLTFKAFSIFDNNKTFDNKWLNSTYKINEIASIYYIHGLEVDYVIIYILKGIKLNDRDYVSFKDKILTNRFETLLTRALVGAYIYCEDEPLYNILKNKLKYNKF